MKTMQKTPRIRIDTGFPINSQVRSLVHAMGYRFRLDDEELPGRPHLVFRALKLVMFTVECAQHPHPDCVNALNRLPTSRWQEVNTERLAIVDRVFRMRGFNFACFWSCQTEDEALLKRRLKDVLKAATGSAASGTRT